MVAAFWLIMLVSWVLAMWVGHEIGKNKHRSGFWWGFWLGWLGVIIVALLPHYEKKYMIATEDDKEIVRLEKEIRIAELRKQYNELHYSNPPEGYRYRPDGQLEADV